MKPLVKYYIKYNSRQKEVLENAIRLALAWHGGDIEPVCELLLKIYKREHPTENDFQDVIPKINLRVKRMRTLE